MFEQIQWAEVGIGGAVAILVLKEVFNFIKEMRKDNSCVDDDKERRRINNKIEALYEWHNVKDENGVPIWYHRPQAERIIEKMAENIATQTEVLKDLSREIRSLHDKVKD